MNNKTGMSFLVLILAAAPVMAENSFQRFRSLLIDFFAEQGYIPVIVDRGYKLGDVVNIDGVNLYARGERCFPTLKVPSPVTSALPDVVRVDDAALSWGLRLRQIFNSSIGADLARRIEIKFSDVKVISVTLLELREALDRNACPEIAPLIDGTLAPLQSNERPYFVISEVMIGKREAQLEFASRADLAFKTKQLTGQVASTDLAVSTEGGGIVTLTNKTATLIAIKPVTVPNIVKIASFSNEFRGSETESLLQWQPIDCQPDGSCWNRFNPFAEQVKATDINLSPEDLER